jgi:hypothetical protein
MQHILHINYIFINTNNSITIIFARLIRDYDVQIIVKRQNNRS